MEERKFEIIVTLHSTKRDLSFREFYTYKPAPTDDNMSCFDGLLDKIRSLMVEFDEFGFNGFNVKEIL